MSEYRDWSHDVNTSIQQEEATFSLAKVFTYMFAGLLITTIVMLGLGGLFRHLFGIGDAFAEQTPDFSNDNALMALLIVMIVSFVGLIVMSFVFPMVLNR